MICWNRIAIQANLGLEALYWKEYLEHCICDIKSRLSEEFVRKIELDKPYIVKLSFEQAINPRDCTKQVRFVLSYSEVPEKEIQFVRQYKHVTVDALEIENINCRNCAAPIPVGKLDLNGYTLVRCSYCGTYHTIRKKGDET